MQSQNIFTASLVLILCITVSDQRNIYSHEYTDVLTKYGPIKGIRAASRLGRPYFSFRGIPYAKPPVGNLRFKAPEPPEFHADTWDATKEGPFCIQKNYFFANPQVIGQEDCLYLNVYSPLTYDLLPVMVFIHWGGFFAGRGTSDYLGPEYLMDKDVILVTFNYRLGPLGFLTTLDDVAPGNYAFKDQVLALKWVQENIIQFGGDSSRITIFGQSAGAGSVHYHLLSPQSRGLFHRAISQSGNALAVWAVLGNAQQSAVLPVQANLVGCGEHVGHNQELISCLRNISAYDLVESQDKFKTFHVDPLTVYTTVKEVKTDANPEPFLTKDPIEYIQSGEFANVPWILGVVEDEGLLKVEELLRSTEIREDLNANFESVFSNQLMGLSLSTNDTKQLYDDIKNQYFLGNDYINVSNAHSIQGFIDVYSDRLFSYSAYQSAMLHAAKQHFPVWFYHFGYKGKYSYGDWFASTNETIDFNWGVSHCDDLLYLFRSPGLFPELEDEVDLVTLEVLTDIWTSFATHGDPNASQYLNKHIEWWPVNINGLDDMKNENFCFFNVTGSYSRGLTTEPACGFYKERMLFWSSRKLNENFDGLQ